MAVMEQLEAAGLDVELEGLFVDFLLEEEDGETADKLKASIDEAGLKGNKTMKLVGLLQREKKLKPGLYKELVSLNARLEEGGSTDDSGGEEVTNEEVQVEEAAAEEAADNVVELKSEFTSKEEDKIRERMKKEEEKMRERLAKREAKIRERMKARAEKQAERRGMKLEHAQKIKECQDEIKVLREEMKERREKVAVLRAQIKELRPTRKRKPKEEGAEGPKKSSSKKSSKKSAEAAEASA